MCCSYWDWTLDWKDVTKSPVWDLEEGFGGNGNVSIKEPLLDGYCLTQGPFSRLEVPYIGADYKPHCLSRRFQSGEKLARLGQALAPQAVESVLNLSDYESFNLALEDGPHLAVPKIIRGDFQYFTAPNGLSIWSLSNCRRTDLIALRPLVHSPPHATRSFMVDMAADRARGEADRVPWQGSA